MQTTRYRPTLLAIALTLAACSPDPRRPRIGEVCTLDGPTCESGTCLSGYCLEPEGDNDLDTLTNAREHQLGSNPLHGDTDGDGISDSLEAPSAMDATAPDHDGDGLPDILESALADADGDCIADQFDSNDSDATADLAAMVPLICPLEGVCAPPAALSVVCLEPGDPGSLRCDFSAIDTHEPTETTCDGLDNDCDGVTDPGAPDLDGDGVADCVDDDLDGDTITNKSDNCVLIPNADQTDIDDDTLGDACDTPDPPTFTTITAPQTTPPETSPATPPAAPLFTGPHPEPTLIGTANKNHQLRIFRDDPACSGSAPILATADDTGRWTAPIRVDALSTTTFHAVATNRAGLASPCTKAPFAYHHVIARPPTPTWVLPTGPDTGTATEIPVTLCARDGDTPLLVVDDPATPQPCGIARVSDALNLSLANNDTSCAAGWNAWTGQAPTLQNTTTEWRLLARDAYGNLSDCSAPRTYQHDGTGPAAPTITDLSVLHWDDTTVRYRVTVRTEASATVHALTDSGPTPQACAGLVRDSATADHNGHVVLQVSAPLASPTDLALRATDNFGNPGPCGPAEPLVGWASASLDGLDHYRENPAGLKAGHVTFHRPDGSLITTAVLANDDAIAEALVFRGAIAAAWWAVLEQPGDVLIPNGRKASHGDDFNPWERRIFSPHETRGVDSAVIGPGEHRTLTLTRWQGSGFDQLHGPFDPISDHFVFDIVDGPSEPWEGRLYFQKCANLISDDINTFSCNGSSCRIYTSNAYQTRIFSGCIDSITCISDPDGDLGACAVREYTATIAIGVLPNDPASRTPFRQIDGFSDWQTIRWRSGEGWTDAHAVFTGPFAPTSFPTDAWTAPRHAALVLPPGTGIVDVAQACEPGRFLEAAPFVRAGDVTVHLVPLRENCSHHQRTCTETVNGHCTTYEFSDDLLIVPRTADVLSSPAHAFPPADPSRSAWARVPVTWTTRAAEPVPVEVPTFSDDIDAIDWRFPGGRGLDIITPDPSSRYYVILDCLAGTEAIDRRGLLSEACGNRRTCLETDRGTCATWQYAARGMAVGVTVVDSDIEVTLSQPFDLQWTDRDWTIPVVTGPMTPIVPTGQDRTVTLVNDLDFAIAASAMVDRTSPILAFLDPTELPMFSHLWQNIDLAPFTLAPGQSTQPSHGPMFDDARLPLQAAVVTASVEAGFGTLVKRTSLIAEALLETAPAALSVPVSRFVLPEVSVDIIDPNLRGVAPIRGNPHRLTLRRDHPAQRANLRAFNVNYQTEERRFEDGPSGGSWGLSGWLPVLTRTHSRVHLFPETAATNDVVLPLETPPDLAAWQLPWFSSLSAPTSVDRRTSTTRYSAGLFQLLLDRYSGFAATVDAIGTDITRLPRFWAGDILLPTIEVDQPDATLHVLQNGFGRFGWGWTSLELQERR